MSRAEEANVGELVGFKWGNKRGVGVKNKEIQYYESFVYEGVEYFLYDCVYLYPTGHLETSIGKLVKIYERPTREKMIKVVWFFRPIEISNFLGQYQPCWNELFLASGQGKGVSNLNFLESIIGKCSVVCTSKDKRNPKPSETELKKAHYFFKHTFDVVRRVIIDQFANEIDGIKVERYFNRKGNEKANDHLPAGTNTRPKIVIKTKSDPPIVSHCQVDDKAEVRTSEKLWPEQSSDYFPHKKRKIVEEKAIIDSKISKEEEISEKKVELGQDERVRTCKNVVHVMEKPDAEKRRWFKKLPWDERLQMAHKLDTLVLLNNLDPSYTSYEVEDLVWCALNAKVETRMIDWTPTYNPYYGRALVIFKTKDAAESAISELNRRCLILGEGRVVSARKFSLREPGKKRKFLGHLVIDKAPLKKQRLEMRNAVSTSHCSQPNNIEYEMAIEWQLHNEKLDAFRNALYQKQMKELQYVKSKLRVDSNLSLSNPT